jgi:hypothetical protein
MTVDGIGGTRRGLGNGVFMFENQDGSKTLHKLAMKEIMNKSLIKRKEGCS